MAVDKRRINIMSSCDDNYAKLVPVQLLSIADNLLPHPPYIAGRPNYEVHYYIFHSQVGKGNLEYLSSYCKALGIAFHEIHITDVKQYEDIASLGGSWPKEAYYSLECFRYLPPDVDRVLYIDAADVLILGDIGEYYFGDFGGCSIIATSINYKINECGQAAYESSDLSNKAHRQSIFRGLFNSGSYVINVAKMRQENISFNDYILLKNELQETDPNNKELYFGDQGFLSAAFVGDIKYFGYPETVNIWYQPYNFCIWFFDRATEMCGGNPWYVPKILHFATGAKPWKLTGENEKELKPGQWPFYKIYQLYADQVPPGVLQQSH